MDKKGNATENTPYDDVFRTMVTKGGDLVIPFINEMFPQDPPIPRDAAILNLSNELFVDDGNGKQKKLITDSYLRIHGKSYHLECQSLDDGAILLRMFQYDMGIAMQEAAKGQFHGYHLTVTIPRSGVLFLRKTKQTPEHMDVTLDTPGGKVEYSIPAARLADYTLDELLQKKLYFLLPFYMFNVEREFPRYERGEEQARKEVLESLDRVLHSLNTLYGDEEIRPVQCMLITGLLQKVTEHLADKYESLRKEIDAIMGGHIIEFKWEKPFNAGKAEGQMNDLLGLVYDGLLPEPVAMKRAKEKYGIPEAVFRKKLAAYHPEDERMQG